MKLCVSDKCQRGPDGFGRGGLWVNALDLPGVQPNHGLSHLEGECNFGKRAVPAAHGNEGIGCAHNEGVSGMAHVGGNHHVHIGIGGGAVRPRKQPEGQRDDDRSVREHAGR